MNDHMDRACHDAFARRMTGGSPPDLPLTGAMEAILGHRSCRAYADTPIPDALLEGLVLAALSAPSSCNLQAWSVVAVTDPATRDALNAVSGRQAHIAQAPMLLCFVADLARLESIAAANGQPADMLDSLEMLLVGTIDASLAAQNLSVAAQSYGLGTCYIGGLRNQIDEVARILALPPRVAPLFGMTLGYPRPGGAGEVKPRLPLNVILHRDSYGPDEPALQVAAYEQRLEAFNAGQGRTVDLWGAKSAKRIATAEALEGRDQLRSKLNDRNLARW